MTRDEIVEALTNARHVLSAMSEGYPAQTNALADIAAVIASLALPQQDEWRDRRFRIEHDGFVGTVIGTYTRLDGKRGVVMQQDGTNVVHVYGEKWLTDNTPEGLAAAPSPPGESGTP